MATLVLTAVGTAIGGPVGGAIGSLIGSQLDGAVFGRGDREGPRLQELAVTTSSYGMPIPRHFGTMRAAGSIIWATDLVESSDESGGKGQPTVTTYSYSISFAVALASRPIASIGRIWADGNLLRGGAGDLKVGGNFRLYTGEGDQQPDPLIAADKGALCPAFRGMAYCVFEDLQLADFGNRIPALTFEIVADTGEVTLQSILSAKSQQSTVDRALDDLQGYSDGGGPLQYMLETVDRLYPMACDATGAHLTFFDAYPSSESVVRLPEAAIDVSGESFGATSGRTSQQRADATRVPSGLRYYDVDRDYQSGMQRAGGRAQPGRNHILEFPGALAAGKARELANDAAERANWSQERLAYRVAELDPDLGPGRMVAIDGKPGNWRIEAWEWRENGLELELLRMPYRRNATVASDAGTSLPPKDVIASPTRLIAFELPWDGQGSPDQRQIFAAASAATSGWTGATLYADQGGSLVPIAGTGSRRCITGRTTAPLPPSGSLIFDRCTPLDVQLDSDDFVLSSMTPEDLANGANRALVGNEILQFCHAQGLGSGMWRLSGLLRGRGGTEPEALAGAGLDVPFCLLDQKPTALDSAKIGASNIVAAIGLADSEPVIATISTPRRSLKPLSPVHGKAVRAADGSVKLCWRRRSRGAWNWQGQVDVPLNEQSERYEVGLGDPDRPHRVWETDTSILVLDPAEFASLRADFEGAAFWVRQIGTHDRSEPLFLTNIS